MRSVIYAPNCHGYAEHPTQKPIEIIDPLLRFTRHYVWLNYPAEPQTMGIEIMLADWNGDIPLLKKEMKERGFRLSERFNGWVIERKEA